MRNFIVYLVLGTSVSLFFNNCGSPNNKENISDSNRLLSISTYDENDNLVNEHIQYENIQGKAVVQGDIILAISPEVSGVDNLFIEKVGHSKDAFKGQAFHALKSGRQWTNEEIPTMLSPDLSHWQKNAVINSINQINKRLKDNNIKLRYTLIGSSDQVQNYIEVMGADYYASWLGMIGGRQELTMASVISTGNLKHEFMHAAGLAHEHNRFDRDRYIRVYQENITPEKLHNFTRSQILSNDIGSYDYDSIMHYSAYSFSKNSSKTIAPVDINIDVARLGQREKLSEKDLSALKVIYGSGDLPYIEYPLFDNSTTDNTPINITTGQNPLGQEVGEVIHPEPAQNFYAIEKFRQHIGMGFMGKVLVLSENEVCEIKDTNKFKRINELSDFLYQKLLDLGKNQGQIHICSQAIYEATLSPAVSLPPRTTSIHNFVSTLIENNHSADTSNLFLRKRQYIQQGFKGAVLVHTGTEICEVKDPKKFSRILQLSSSDYSNLLTLAKAQNSVNICSEHYP